jgi:hypothetical protein
MHVGKGTKIRMVKLERGVSAKLVEVTSAGNVMRNTHHRGLKIENRIRLFTNRVLRVCSSPLDLL